MRSTLKYDIIALSSGGKYSMKTKIIYISGNETFEMADIRAAFEEVRATLNLGRDTVLFGVPVDSDNALKHTENLTEQDDTAIQITNTPDTATNSIDTFPEPENEINETVDTTVITAVPEETKPVKKPRGRRKSVGAVATDNAEQIAKDNKPEMADGNDEKTEKIIPILSILAANQDSDALDSENAQNQPIGDDNATITGDASNADDDAAPIIADIDISAELTTENDNGDEIETHTTIADMINDDAPDAPMEKTLEQLLESMAPLREDIVEDVHSQTEPEFDADSVPAPDDTDATLEQLATEFAENQDKIPATPKPESHSKIGKLKNILPFKKAKRDDNGIMGDLFGWAGIAANDDDFSIPGFFTNAASKK